MTLKSSLNNLKFNILLIAASLLFILIFIELIFLCGSFFHKSTWADKQKVFVESFTYPFSYGITRPNVSIPDLREYFPSGQLQPEAVSINTNSFGMRMRDIEIAATPGVQRIAIIGDSCTFGWMVPEDKSYPRVLETILNDGTKGKYEVLNFGVPGYTSFHGKLRYEQLVKKFKPDLLILAFGFNDSYEFRFSEEDFYHRLSQNNLTEGIKGFPLFIYDHSLFGQWFINRIKSFGKNTIEQEMLRRASEKIWLPRVDRESYKNNLRYMIKDIRSRGGDAILLHLNLPNTFVKKPLYDLSDELKVDLIEVQDIFLKKRQDDYPLSNISETGWRTTENNQNTQLLFRVWVPQLTKITDSIYLLLNTEDDSWPNQMQMFDDGTHGDEHGNDGVWSLKIQAPDQDLIDYSFCEGPISTEAPLYENSLKALRYYHHIDLSTGESTGTWISPPHIFGMIPFKHLMVPGDPIHPNALGHKIIAESLAPVVNLK
jgi:lysophospholipase L1-like esterase